MSSKRLLTMLLALVLVFSCVSPAAHAVQIGENSVLNTDQSQTVDTSKNEASPNSNSLLVSGDSSVNTLRDESGITAVIQGAETTGGWTATEVETDIDLTMTEVPECIEELKEAAEYYEAGEKVVAFVVMEAAPLSSSVRSISQVTAAQEEKLLAVQDQVIDQIETKILNNSELDVRYQFTYLTNSFSIETEFENLAKIAKLDGVKSVFIMPVYNAITVEDAASPNTFSAGEMTGVDQVWEELEYTGEGMKIAIIDTGLDLDHPSFAAAPALTDDSLTADDIAAVLSDLNISKVIPGLTAADLYRSEKVPFAVNYVDGNLIADHSSDSQGDHGTHVAGIAAANALDTTNVVGMAPDAQLIVLKVFGAYGGAYMDDIAAAIEDAMTLGCDVINASLGSSAGFSSSNSEIDAIYDAIAEHDVVVTFSAGNDGTSSAQNLWGTDQNNTSDPDNATVNSPSTYANVMSIASADNAKVYADYLELADGTKVVWNSAYEWYYGYVENLAVIAGTEYEYVIIDGLGEEADFYDEEGNSLVEGKVAVVKRGALNFGTKVENAELAGAVACLIWNNEPGTVLDFYISVALTDADGYEYYPSIPAGLISMEDGQIMADAQTKTMTVSEDQTITDSATAGQISSFSSWGVSSDLRLLPDVTGVGGSVYSCYDGGSYGYMSGTSMSAPQVAGVTALVMQYLKEKGVENYSDVAEALLMSTADVIINSDTGLESSPRQQGAGLVDAYEAITSDTYLTVNGGRPKAELGDSTTGNYVFSFEIHNMSEENKTYMLAGSLLTEDVVSYSVYPGEYFMAGYETELSGSVTFESETVTVPAGETASVKVTIKLSDEDKAMFDKYWENGGYVEGYVYLYTITQDLALEDELNLPFLGFYGDWTEAPVFDTAYWYDNSFWGAGDGSVDGAEYWHVVWTDLAGTDWVLGFNPYSGATVDSNGNIIYDAAHNVISPNGDGAIDGIEELYLSLMRNADKLTFNYTVDGEILHSYTTEHGSKSMYRSAYGQVVPWIYTWYAEENFFDLSSLADGTEVMLNIDADVEYGTGGDHSLSIPLYVDSTAPVLTDIYQVQSGSTNYLVVEASNETPLAAIYLMNTSGTRYYDYLYDYEMDVGEDGNYVAVFDVTGLGTDFMLALCDFGANEGYYNIKYTASGDNLPDMSAFEDQIFAYRIYDSVLSNNYYYYEHAYGWVSVDSDMADEYANISVWSDDYMEYYALTAAEYVDGRIFAVDAGYNLVVLNPGLFDRQTICNLGVNVIDMTFDDSTDTMYVLSKQGSYMYLYSMDLLTGELTYLKYYGYFTSDKAPWAITDDDNGTIYAIKCGNSGIYTLDENYNLVAVTTTDADGVASDVVITDSNGTPVTPSYYSQSITWKDGTLYWAYYYASYNGDVAELIAIDTESWTSTAQSYAALGYDSENNLVNYYPETELVGLMTLTDTEYKIPAATELNSVIVSADSLIMKVGDSEKVTFSLLPWNYDEKEVSWSSSDESVVTVENGTITAVGEGYAVVTVTVDGVSAEIAVTAVQVSGHFNAYNYYSYDGYYGNMIDVDMESMDYYLTATAPVDFIAGDYNGHDGCFYGYTENGQLYRWNMSSGECAAVGAVGEFPIDMAYDYSTGLMYGLFTNLSNYESKLKVINMNTGATETVVDITGDYWMSGMMTLACDDNGTLYLLDYMGYLYTIAYMYDDWFETWGYQMSYSSIYDSLGEAYYVQSMCWDHANGVLLWAHCDGNSINWINVDEGYMIQLGDPTESGLFEFVGMYTVPAEIPELSYVAVEDVVANDMLVLVGGTKNVDATIYPFNATNQNMVLTSADETIAKVENGMVVGVSEGKTTISYTLTDGESVIEGTINVTVLQGADNVYGHILSDLAYGNIQNWAQIYPEDVNNPDYLAYSDYVLFAEEYVDGKLYAYGYDPNDWTANWQYFVIDPDTFEIESKTDMGESFPYVYDMTYDYTTGTMYCVAGASEDEMNLYVADKQTGKVCLLMQTEQNFMSIAAAEDGKLYAIENSVQGVIGYDDWGWEIYGYTNAQLYSVDVKTLEITHIGDMGMQCDMIASMAYDYDTKAMYWTPLSYYGNGVNGLAIVDLETGAATNLGTIGPNGSQVSGLYIISDEYPETASDDLYHVVMDPSKASLNIGQTAALNMLTIPVSLSDADVTWASSDESVATVDQNGVVTALAQGKVEITATVTYNGKTLVGTCTMSVMAEDASFLTWNRTDMGWSAILRSDYSQVTNLTEGEEVGVSAFAATTDGSVYAYDLNDGFFKLNTETFAREYIASELGTDYTESLPEGYEYDFVVRDMAYDAANERMLVLGAVMLYDADYDYYDELYSGCALYEVDLATGELTNLYTFADFTYVYSLAVSPNGDVYFYTTFDDGIYKLDVENESYIKVVTLQTQSLYGEYGHEIRQAMHYDDLTDILYMTFTSNGKYYRMVTIDSVTGAISAYNEEGSQMYIGDVTYANWAYNGDLFSGLAFVELNMEPAVDPVVNPFEDVTEEDYFYDGVMWAVANGITNGVTATTFAPEKECTRAEMMTFIWRAAGSPKPESSNNPFTDVKAGTFYYDAVLWAVENGITTGTTATTFSPNATCTRAQAVTFLYRWNGEKVNASNPFTDVKASAYYYDAVLWAVANGITNGMSATTFAPETNCTRGQVVTFLYRNACN